MRLAILGVGSLGTILGAYIQKAGVDIDLVDVNQEHVDALNEHGATVIGTVDMNVPVKAMTPDQMEGIYDVVFYMAKQTHNEEALKGLLPHLGEDSIVVTLQNGVPEPAVAAIVGDEKVMGCPVGWGATWIKPGVSELTSNPNNMTFDLGEYKGEVRDRTKEVQKLLELMCTTHLVDNLMGMRWTKVLVNATFSGMSASLGCDFGTILDNPKAMDCIKHIANECINIARAADIKMGLMQGYDLEKLLAFSNKEEMDRTEAVYQATWGPHRKLKASMLQDLEKGKKTEIGAINGIVCEFGRKYGVPTPINDTVVEIVTGIEEGKYTYEMKNLDMFIVPEVN